MNNLTNYHSHCDYCDGKATAEEFVKEAIRLGFYSYGISSHAPLPFATKWSLDAARVPAYLEELNGLKQSYADRIELYLGMEIDYLTEEHQPANDYFQSLPLDYRIGSVHLLHDVNGVLADIDVSPEKFAVLVRERFDNDLKGLVCAYFDKLMRMVQTGGFDFVGHADKISMNASFCESDITSQSWYQEKINAYFTLIASTDLMVEINTKAFSTKGFFFPNRQHFKLLRELAIPVLVNSDSHQLHLINDGRMEALRALKENGIQCVRELHAGRWIEKPIVISY